LLSVLNSLLQKDLIMADAKTYIVPGSLPPVPYMAPKTVYCKTPEEFDSAIGSDFIDHANKVTEKGEQFLVGLSHGQSPSGAYQYILDHFSELTHPEKIHYTFINSKLERQRGLVGTRDAISFIKKLIESNKISKDQVLGRALDRNNMEAYGDGLDELLGGYLSKLNKKGLDYVFVASTSKGQVAGITKNSTAFDSNRIVVVVHDSEEPELTFTPSFLKKSARIVFLATKSDKRRPLASLFYRWARPDQSPSFLRFIPTVEERMVVFIDDKALTWPQVELTRKTKAGDSKIRLDLPLPFDKDLETNRPVLLIIHGFLGLNTFDALLTFIPSEKYIPVAMHYGSIPDKLKPKDYSHFVADNIDFVVDHFGSHGHPVYIFDHSMANTYLSIIDRDYEKYPGIKKYLKGRIAANPFFGRETKHASTEFMDNVILKSRISAMDMVVFNTAKAIIPALPRNGVRNIGIKISEWLIRSDSSVNERIWKAIKERILVLAGDMDSIPALNKVPLEHTLNRLPIKIFAIQVQSALRESKKFDGGTGFSGFEENNIPVLVLKSEIDPIAKFVEKRYEGRENVMVLDISNHKEKDIFREHLYYMIHPRNTIKLIDQFIQEIEGED
jgi:6-phosphogluconolactonase/glucosamine-6-phosphate isomerase/deaminase